MIENTKNCNNYTISTTTICSASSDTIPSSVTANYTDTTNIQQQHRYQQRGRSFANQQQRRTQIVPLQLFLFVAIVQSLLQQELQVMFLSSPLSPLLSLLPVPRITTMTTAFRTCTRTAPVATTAPRYQHSSFRWNLHRNGWYSSNRHRHYLHRRLLSLSQRYSTSNKEETTATSVPTTDVTESIDSMAIVQRLSAKGLSLDIKTITNNYDVVYSHMVCRNPANTVALNAIQSIANTAQQRTTFIQQRDSALNERRTLSDQIGALLRQQKAFLSQHNLPVDMDVTTMDDPNLKEEYQQMINELERKRTDSNRVAAIAEETDEQLNVLQTEMDEQLSILPNLLDDQVPVGRDEADNEVIYTHGDIYALPQRLGWPEKYCRDTTSSSDTDDDDADSWKPAWHDDIATRVEGYMSDAAVQMSGSRFIALRADIAQLERAIGQWMLDLHTSPEHNYVEVSVPYVVSRSTLVGTGQLPKFEEDLFAINSNSHTCNGEDAFLIPTAEVPITNLHRNEVLNEEDLPISYVALTPCFRAEAGSYGRDTKGLIRTHQFHKVELVKITSATTSQEQHELLTTHAEKCLKLLELPYRKVRLCSGDIGFSANHCYDLEVYLPGSQEYREISSCSNTGDFQARRLALRYRPKPTESTDATKGKKKGGAGGNKVKPVLCHTINGSGLAVGRTLVAILENYQRPDGSIVIPDVLRPYMKGKDVIVKPNSATLVET